MRTYETKGGAVVVMDPNTGEILALASTPGYNPNDYTEADPDSRRDRAVTDRFEPGSRDEGVHDGGGARAGRRSSRPRRSTASTGRIRSTTSSSTTRT